MANETYQNMNLNVFRKLHEDAEVIKKLKTPVYKKIAFVIFYMIMCFTSILFPVIGLFFYIIWKNDNPKRATIIGLFTLLGFLLNFALGFYQQFYPIISGERPFF